MANLQLINITMLHFCIWQHLGNNRSDTQLQHLATIPSIPVYKVYQHLLNSTLQLTTFNTEPSEDTNSLWSLFTHPGIYVSALGSLIPVGIGLFCCYFFWCWPARFMHWPLQPGNTWYTIVDDNVEVAPIYRCDGKAPKPTRPCKNHGLVIEHLPTCQRVIISYSRRHLQSLLKDHWVNHPKSRGHRNGHNFSRKT